jgi:hypothetical protein
MKCMLAMSRRIKECADILRFAKTSYVTSKTSSLRIKHTTFKRPFHFSATNDQIPTAMKIKLPSRNRLPPDDSLQKPSRRPAMGMGKRAASCKSFQGTVTTELTSRSIFMRADERAIGNATGLSTVENDTESQMHRSKESTRAPHKQPSLRNYFSLREEPQMQQQHQNTQTINLQRARASKMQRQDALLSPIPEDPRCRKMLKPSSVDPFELEGISLDLSPPELARTQSAPLQSHSRTWLQKEHFAVTMKASIRKLDQYLADLSNQSDDDDSIHEVLPPVEAKATKVPLRNPYAKFPTLSSSHHKKGETPASLCRRASSRGLYCIPDSVLMTDTTGTDMNESFSSISESYKKIMLEFGEESYEATTGW